MADTKELTENEQRALEEYHTGGGWYQYPGEETKVRKDELLEMLDGDEFVGGPPAKPTEPEFVDPDGWEVYRRELDAYLTEQQQEEVAVRKERVKRAEGEPVPAPPEPPKHTPLAKPETVSTKAEPEATAKVDAPVLRLGSRNHSVLALRSLLAVRGWPTDPTRDLFDHDLERSVVEFQQDRRIPADGVVHGKTWERLLDSKA